LQGVAKAVLEIFPPLNLFKPLWTISTLVQM